MDILTREQVAGAIARAYCRPGCTDIEVDARLIEAATDEVMTMLSKLRSAEPVAWWDGREADANSVTMIPHSYKCNAKPGMFVGYKYPLYTHPAPSEGDRRDAERLAFELIDKWLSLGPDGAEHVRAQIAAMSKEQGNGG